MRSAISPSNRVPLSSSHSYLHTLTRSAFSADALLVYSSFRSDFDSFLTHSLTLSLPNDCDSPFTSFKFTYSASTFSLLLPLIIRICLLALP